MKKYLTFLILIFSVFQVFPQSSNLAEELADLQLQLVNKISIGSTPEEVKSKLGKPTAVEAGFPDAVEFIFFEEFNPNQAGQLNYSTWFYRLTKKTISYTIYSDTSYFVNGEEVTSDLYNYYLDKDSVYYKVECTINEINVPLDIYYFYLDKDSVYLNSHSKIDFPKIINAKVHDASVRNKGKYMKKESQNMKLEELEESIPKIRHHKNEYPLTIKTSQEMKVNLQHSTSATFLPILCVVFEKGTNVVATVKSYFQLM